MAVTAGESEAVFVAGLVAGVVFWAKAGRKIMPKAIRQERMKRQESVLTKVVFRMEERYHSRMEFVSFPVLR
jgi:hypothetical protein